MSAFAYLLRTLGLEIANSPFRAWRDPETPKPVLHRSFRVALFGASIHVLPMAVLAGLIYLNYRTFYIGPDFTWKSQNDPIFLAVIQVAAKVEELLCVASLSAIVMQALRRELLGDGIPIGLLGSGTWFSQISSFWSPDFLVAARWSITTLQRCQLYALIILAGIIATVIGPASAVLMLPRAQDVPAGGTSYYLNGTADRFWPDTVYSGSELEVCGLPNSTKYAVCPSGGYESLRQTLSTFNYSNFYSASGDGNAFAPQIQAKGIAGNRQWENLLVQSPQSLVPPVLSSLQLRGLELRTVAVQPHAATAIILQQLVRDWTNAVAISTEPSWAEYQWTYGLLASGSTSNPSVRVRCTDAQNLSAKAGEALFPYLYQLDYSVQRAPDPFNSVTTLWAADFRNSTITGLDRNETSHIRTQWTPLAIDTFGIVGTGTVTSGLLVEFPWDYGSRVAVACSVSAAWHNSTISSDRSVDYDAWSVEISRRDNGVGIDNPDADRLHRPVTLDDSWLSLLTPAAAGGISTPESWVPNTLESIFSETEYASIISDLRTRPQQRCQNSSQTCYWGMMNSSLTDTELWNDASCGKGTKSEYTEFVLALLVADGLSRYGSHLAYDIQPTLRDWTLRAPQTFDSSRIFARSASSPAASDSLIAQRLNIDVVGYAYFASTTTDYLALAVASAYILLAGAHVLWVLWPKHLISSSAWNTVTELLVLCQNSLPAVPSRLDNTSAGINHLRTHATTVKVRATKPADGLGNARLMLVLEDDPEDKDRTVATNLRDDRGRTGNGGRTAKCKNGASKAEAVSTPVRMVHSLRQRSLDIVEVDTLYS